MKHWKGMMITAVAALASVVAVPARAQTPTASAHGHVTNPAGQALTTGEVKLTKDKTVAEKDQKFTNSFPLDKSGNYTAKDIAPGDYFAYVLADGKRIDRIEVTFKAGDDKVLDFDMTREEYLKGLTPEERKNIEEYKKRNAEAVSANKVVANLNATLNKTREDLKNAGATHADVSADVEAMKGAVTAKPDEGILWVTYGDTLQAQADHLAAEDRAAKKSPQTDDAVVKGYTDAGDAYKKGIDLNAASKKPDPLTQATGYNQMGNALAKAGKLPESASAFESAAKAVPANAGMYYNNEAAVLFNANKFEESLAAAEKAIAADPNRPDPYFIKGQVLIAKSTFDQKTSKLVAPPGCVDAYQKFMELAPPENKNRAQVEQVLASLGEKINTKYSAGKKR